MGWFNKKPKKQAAVNPYKIPLNDLFAIARDDNLMVSLHVGPEGNYESVTDNVEDIIGCKPEELYGTSAYQYIHPADLVNVAESHHWILKGQDVNTIQYRLRHKNGKYIWVETTCWFLKDQTVMALTQKISVDGTITKDKMKEVIERVIENGGPNGN
jgi:PAS domain S-box-containing protein